ncbi:MAG: SDR family oxidoreductase [Planctomycetes bacterium]|nr:SDR family oxidoreductase [Planctomycetota bacterium]
MSRPSCRTSSPSSSRRGRVEVLEGRLLDPHLGLSDECLASLRGRVRGIFHAAADVSFDPARDARVLETNVEGTRRALELAAQLGVPLFHVSTAYVAGERTGIVPEGEPAPFPRHRNAYERSKWTAEGLVLQAREHGIASSIFRPSIILGDRAHGTTRAFSTLYSWMQALHVLAERVRATPGEVVDLDLRFPAEPASRLPVVPIDYVVDAMLWLVEHTPSGSIHHLTCRDVPQNVELAELLHEALRVRGVSLVPPDALEPEAFTTRERRLQKAVRTYDRYLALDLDFDDRETQERLAPSGIEAPRITEEWIQRITAFALEREFGREKARRPRRDPVLELARQYFLEHLTSFLGQKMLPDLAKLDARFAVELTPECIFEVEVRETRLVTIEPVAEVRAPAHFLAAPEIFLRIVAAELDPREAFFQGKTQIRGDLEKGLSLVPIMARFFQLNPHVATV